MEVRPSEEIEIVNVATGAKLSSWIEGSDRHEVGVRHMRAGDVTAIICHGLLQDGPTLHHKARVVNTSPFS